MTLKAKRKDASPFLSSFFSWLLYWHWEQTCLGDLDVIYEHFGKSIVKELDNVRQYQVIYALVLLIGLIELCRNRWAVSNGRKWKQSQNLFLTGSGKLRT